MNIDRHTYEEFFLLYIDDELSSSERQMVEDFARQHPDLAEELETLADTRFTPDEEVVFKYKEDLYRHEEERKVVPFRWWKPAAAAAVMLGLGLAGWLNLGRQKMSGQTAPGLARSEAPAPAPGKIVPTTPAQTNNDGAGLPDISKSVENSRERRALPNATPRADNKAPDVNTVARQVQQTERRVQRLPERAVFDEPLALTAADRYNADVEVKVEPRELEPVQYAVNTNPVENYAHYAAEEVADDKDVIYFANTSFSKKNKLRVVFRKATRILDKVTSIQ